MSTLKLILRLNGYKKEKGKPPVTPPVVPSPTDFQTFIWDKADLEIKRSNYAADKNGTGNFPAIRTAGDKLISDGDDLLSKAPYSVVDKPTTQFGKPIVYPFTDMRNAVSYAVYYWPMVGNKQVGNVWFWDASLPYITPDYYAAPGTRGAVVEGPYIKRTTTNPAYSIFRDTAKLADIAKDIQVLAGAYFYSQNEKYAQKAMSFIEYFFTSPTTGMLPNVRYLSIVKGSPDWGGYGTASGFVITEQLHKVCEGFQLIRSSQAVTGNPSKANAFLEWIRQFWYYHTKVWSTPPAKPTQTSTIAQREDYYHWRQLWESKGSAGIYHQWNNIRVLFTTNVTTYALTLGEKEWAIDHFNRYVKDYNGQAGLIRRNVATTTGTFSGAEYREGDLIQEVHRPIPWTYTNKAWTGWVDLMRIGKHIGVDIANYTAGNGANLKRGVERLLFLVNNTAAWQHSGKEDINAHDKFHLAATRLRPLSEFYANDAPMMNATRTYFAKTDVKYATKNTERRESYYQQGKTLAYAFETTAY